MTYKLKRQIVDKIHKSTNTELLKIIAKMLGLKVDEHKNNDDQFCIKNEKVYLNTNYKHRST